MTIPLLLQQLGWWAAANIGIFSHFAIFSIIFQKYDFKKFDDEFRNLNYDFYQENDVVECVQSLIYDIEKYVSKLKNEYLPQWQTKGMASFPTNSPIHKPHTKYYFKYFSIRISLHQKNLYLCKHILYEIFITRLLLLPYPRHKRTT